MTLIEALLDETDQQSVEVYENFMARGIRGLYSDNIIWLNQGLSYRDKACVLAEEMGHYYTSSGNTLDQKQTGNIKQEKRARNWAYEKLIPLQSFVEASKEGITNWYELADFMDVTEEFLEQAMDHYKEKYGLYVEWTSYLIYFEPLGVLELFDE